LEEVKTKSNYFDAVIVAHVLPQLLSYKDVEIFFTSIISVLKPNGFIEVCEYTGDAKFNLSQYTNVLDCFRCKDEKNNKCFGFKLIWEQCLRDSIYKNNDWNDHCWFLQKAEFEMKEDIHSIREFLDKNQYTEYGIRAYEWIFGAGFISPGGAEQNGTFLAQLDLKPGDTVLDIGCGIGGNSFQIAREYGAHVMGVDLSSNMVTIACDRACLRRDTRVRFLIADITKFDFPPNTFEVVYSRDCIIHIPDKRDLFTKIFKWLKPNGKLLITDYMVGEKEFTDEFKGYIASRSYALTPLRKYKEAAEAAKFSNVEAVDMTGQLLKTIETELEKAIENKQEFLQMFPADKYDHLVDGWKNKIKYIASGDQKWGMIKAVKL